jgi:hypothetical protein
MGHLPLGHLPQDNVSMNLALPARRLFAILTTLAWALWFGGTIALFLFVTRLFHEAPVTAKRAAPILFITFGKYQLILAGAAVVFAGIYSAIAARSRSWYPLALLLVLITALVPVGWLVVMGVEGRGSIDPMLERLHLGLAAFALAGILLWQAWQRSNRLWSMFVAALVLAAACAFVLTIVVNTRMEVLLMQRVSSGEAFGRLHSLSRTLGTAEAVLLLVAGVLLPGAHVVNDE